MRVAAIFLLVSLAGCASIPSEPQPATEPPPLYSAYQRFRGEVHSENIHTRYAEFFSPDILDGQDAANKDVLQQLLFDDYMVRVHSHHEKISDDKGCLTVNGFDQMGKPLSFNIEYVSVSQRWLIRATDIVFVSSARAFSPRGRCPSDYITQQRYSQSGRRVSLGCEVGRTNLAKASSIQKPLAIAQH